MVALVKDIRKTQVGGYTLLQVVTSALLALLIPFCYGGTHAIVVGGGYTLESSQGQIEHNVLWLQSLLALNLEHTDFYFGNGEDDTVDVVYWHEGRRNSPLRNPLADVFGEPDDDWLSYKKHTVTANGGTTRKEHLVPALQAQFSRTSENNVLFVYNGHGGYGGYNSDEKNYLKLWGSGELSVTELRSIFNTLPEKTTARFVVAQCYSGGFYHLLNESKNVLEKTLHKRCGFMAEAADRESEGCELGVNKDEFRDYTTYFFSALTQKPRYKASFSVEPDRNGDGEVSFREAHFYALVAALSSDLSRATSEVYLEDWQPWYARWYMGKGEESSEFYALAEQVARQNAISLNESIFSQYEHKNHILSEAVDEQVSLKRAIKKQRSSLVEALAVYYPFLSSPYSSDYIDNIRQQYANISEAIRSQPAYPILIKSLNERELTHQKILALKREITQLEKVVRLKKLARLEAAFQRFASKQARAEYQSLLACENATLDK